MLYLNPPYHIIQGVSVFSDHADPLQFYYLPAKPHLTMIRDEATDTDIPQIQLLKFTGQAGSGGFLNFSVDLGISDEELDDIRREIKTLFQLDALPHLAPALLEDGFVRLMILGKESPPIDPTGGQPTPPATPDDLPDFVLKIDHYAKPALYGDNQAIFSVQLDEAGVALIEASLKGEMMPIGVVYGLDFLALRPAFNVRITADWERVQNHFQEHSEGRVFFFSTEVDDIVDKLIEDQVIKIEIDNFTHEGEDATNVITNPTQVVNEVKDMILDTFFEPSINPISSEQDPLDTATSVATRVSTLAVTGGWAGIASASYKKVDLERVDKKRFNFNMSERTTVRRKIYPQAHIQGLTRVLRDEQGNINLDDFVKAVNIDDPFFQRRKVNVINRANLEADNIASISVSLTYGNDTKTVTLDKDNPSIGKDWASILDNGQMLRDVTVSYTVTFANVDSAERPQRLTSEQVSITSDVFEVNPRADNLYHIINVPLTPLSFPWERYQNVQVDLRYEDGDIKLNDSFLLKEDTTTAVIWPLFIQNADNRTFDYRITYHATDNRDWSTDWISTDTEQILLRDPRPAKRTVEVIPAVSWAQVAHIFVNLSYDDNANDIHKEATLNFNNMTLENQAPKTFSVALEDPDKRLVHYNVKMLFTGNSLVVIPESMTLEKQIFIMANTRGHRIVRIQANESLFTEQDVREVKVALRYLDEDNGLDFASQFNFTSADAVAFFEYDYIDPQHQSFTADVVLIFNNGFRTNKPTQTVSGDVYTVEG